MKNLATIALLAIAYWAGICLAVKDPANYRPAHYRHDGAALLNDLTVTPGDVRTADKNQVCNAGKTTQWRHVSQSLKDTVCVEYGLKPHCDGVDTNEIDHLISLELGGSDDIKNLWPQPYSQHPGAHEKDKVENYLHRQVCSGAMGVTAAQKAIATDWFTVYKSMPKAKP